jgi:hypothetical protein
MFITYARISRHFRRNHHTTTASSAPSTMQSLPPTWPVRRGPAGTPSP